MNTRTEVLSPVRHGHVLTTPSEWVPAGAPNGGLDHAFAGGEPHAPLPADFARQPTRMPLKNEQIVNRRPDRANGHAVFDTVPTADRSGINRQTPLRFMGIPGFLSVTRCRLSAWSTAVITRPPSYKPRPEVVRSWKWPRALRWKIPRRRRGSLEPYQHVAGVREIIAVKPTLFQSSRETGSSDQRNVKCRSSRAVTPLGRGLPCGAGSRRALAGPW